MSGTFRLRRSWRGKLVLEVSTDVPYNYDPVHDTTPGGYSTGWRKAKLSDLPADVRNVEIVGLA